MGHEIADAGHLVGIYLDIAHLHLFISIDDEQSEFLADFYPWRARPIGDDPLVFYKKIVLFGRIKTIAKYLEKFRQNPVLESGRKGI